jgi:Sulfotransferase domain
VAVLSPARAHAIRMRWRSGTAGRRVLPDFVVIGGQRCGSTSLYTILGGHPQVMEASHKELHFFDMNWSRGTDFYRRSFPLRGHLQRRARRLGVRVVSGEASPYYLFHPAVPERLATALPDARLIAILRDPVDRAYSQYQLSARDGHESLSFEDALDAEADRLAGVEQRLATDPDFRSAAHRHQSYQARGMYLEQLERWWRHVPRERLLVLRSEDMFADTAAAYDRAVEFLGLEPHPRSGFESRNRVAYSSMPPAARARLQELYAEPNRRLEEALGRRLEWQRPGASC